MKPFSALFFLALAPLATAQDAAEELRGLVTALARTSYTWETTVRQRFKGDTAGLRPAPDAPLAVQGKFAPAGYTQITLLPSRELPVPVTAVAWSGDAVAQTPDGWLRWSELRAARGTEHEVSFEGKTVRHSRALQTALKAVALRPLTEDLFDLLADLKSCRREGPVILAELRDRTIEQLWGDAEAKRAPEVYGTVIFRAGDDGLAEYHTVIAIGFPNSRTKTVSWSMQQWSVRIRNIGTTAVEPPAAAVAALER